MTDAQRTIIDRSRPHFSRSRHLILAVSEFCDRRCAYCYVPSNSRENRSAIPMAKLDEHFAALSESLNVGLVTLVGGEPSLLLDFEEIVLCIRRNGLDLIVQSNGSLRLDQLELLNDIGVRYVSVSLDSPVETTNDRLRFEGAAALANACIKKCTKLKIPVRISCVVTRSNVGHMPALVNYAKENGVELINVHCVDTLQNPFLRNEALSAREWHSAWQTWKLLAASSHVLLRAPVAFLSKTLSEDLANAGVACPARHSDTINLTPNEKLYRCPLLMAIDKPAWNHPSEIRGGEPLDIKTLIPVESQPGACPVLAIRKDKEVSPDFIHVCPIVKSTLNTTSGARNHAWDNVLGLTCGEGHQQ